ncbi:MAG: hypothetical protein FWG55_09095 [Candidatus Bathyarchaeota archaeon]|nr:hypothetical protein [Candidatus Termiticorpusculum sp.]
MTFCIHIDFSAPYREHLEKVKNNAYNNFDDYDRKQRTPIATHLEPGGNYVLRNEHSTHYNDIANFCISVIDEPETESNRNSFLETLNAKLRVEGKNKINYIQVDRTSNGSIMVLVTIFTFIASISGFVQTINMIKKFIEEYMSAELKKKYSGDIVVVNVSTDAVNEIGKEQPKNIIHKRDGFFYYLFASNIALVAFIIALVWKAVTGTYF